MNAGQVMEIFREAVYVTLKLSAPVLVISVLIGLVISVLQAATQVHEQTLTFVPKLVGIGVILILLGPWMITQMQDFTLRLFEAMLAFA